MSETNINNVNPDDSTIDVSDESLGTYVHYQEDQAPTTYYYHYELKGDKLYIYNLVDEPDTESTKVVAVVDKNLAEDKLDSVLGEVYNNSSETNFSSYGDSSNEINSVIAEIENKTGRTVDSVVLNPGSHNSNDGKCEIIVDGQKYEVDYSEENTNNIAKEVIEKVPSKVKIKTSDALNNENKAAVENYLNEMLPSGMNGKIVLNDQGEYEIRINDAVVRVLDKDVTVAGALYAIVDFRQNPTAFEKSKETNRLKMRTGQNYRININPDDFRSANSSFKNAKNTIDSSKSLYSASMLTGELASFYGSLVGNGNPSTKIGDIATMIENVSLCVTYSLKAYDNLDKDLGLIFNSIVNDLFTMHKLKDDEMSELYAAPLDERETYLDNVIKTYEGQLEELEKEYHKKYGQGVKFDTQAANLILGVIYGFHLDEGQNFSNSNWDEVNGYAYLRPDLLKKAISFIKENDVFGKLNAYANGASWHDSGLSELNYSIISRPNPSDDECEAEFLLQYATLQGNEFTTKLYNTDNNWNDTIRSRGGNFEDIKNNWLKPRILEQLKLSYSVGENESYDLVEHSNMNVFEYAEYCCLDEQSMVDSINSIKNTIYNYKQYKEIMPFEADMDDEEFFEYLVKNYTHSEDLPADAAYLDQKELALYSMYKARGDDDKAAAYLEAMRDLINQRKGFEKAAIRIQKYGGVDGFINAGIDGFGDGVGDFFNGIVEVFNPKTKRSEDDYMKIFLLSLLGAEGKDSYYTKHLTDSQRRLLSANYTGLSAVGRMTIPTLLSFIPGGKVGAYLGSGLAAFSVFGSSVSSAMINGGNRSEAYLYGGLSGASNFVLQRFFGGIAGLNGSTSELTSLQAFFGGMAKQAAISGARTYLDAGLRSVILGEPFNLDQTTHQAFEAAAQGAFTAAVLNGSSKITVKLFNGATVVFSRGKYSNYAEFRADLASKMWSTKPGQYVQSLMEKGGEDWKAFCKNNPDNVFVKMITNNLKPDQRTTIPNETADKMGIKLKDNQKLLFDPNANNYVIVDNQGHQFVVNSDIIRNYEGKMDIKLTREESIWGTYIKYGENAAKEVEISNWAKIDLPEILKNEFAVSSEKAESIGSSFKFFTSKEEWIEFLKSKNIDDYNTAGLHDKKTGMNYVYVENLSIAKHNTIHEGNHSAGTVRNAIGQGRGINEALTEMFALRASRNTGILDRSPAIYNVAAYGLDSIIEKDIPGLTYNDFYEAYFVTHDLSGIKNTVDSICGEGYFERSFLPAFERGTQSSRSNEYRNVVINNAINKILLWER